MTDTNTGMNGRGITDPHELAEQVRQGADDGMPRDLILAVARDMHAMEYYARMSERERQAFLAQARNTPAGESMRRLLHDLRYGELHI
jgi:hypothetical protein